jgi:hypothetical protein
MKQQLKIETSARENEYQGKEKRNHDQEVSFHLLCCLQLPIKMLHFSF